MDAPQKKSRNRGRRKPRRRPPLPAPTISGRIYLEIEPKYLARLKFFLEAYDNLGYMSVIDRFRSVAQIIFSPHQEDEIREALGSIGQSIPFTILDMDLPSATEDTAS